MFKKSLSSLLVMLVVCFLASCDVSDTQNAVDQSGQELPTFEVMNDSPDRITYFSGKGKA